MNRAVNEGILRGFPARPVDQRLAVGQRPRCGLGDRAVENLGRPAGRGPIAVGPGAAKARRPGLPLRSGRPLESHAGPAAYGQPLSGRIARPPRAVFPAFSRCSPGCGDAANGSEPRFERNWSGKCKFVCDHGLRPTHLNGHQYIEMIPAVSAIVPDVDGAVRHRRRARGLGAFAACAPRCFAAFAFGSGRWPG